MASSRARAVSVAASTPIWARMTCTWRFLGGTWPEWLMRLRPSPPPTPSYLSITADDDRHWPRNSVSGSSLRRPATLPRARSDGHIEREGAPFQRAGAKLVTASLHLHTSDTT